MGWKRVALDYWESADHFIVRSGQFHAFRVDPAAEIMPFAPGGRPQPQEPHNLIGSFDRLADAKAGCVLAGVAIGRAW